MADTVTKRPPTPEDTPPRRPDTDRRNVGMAPLIWGGLLVVVGALWLVEMLGADIPWSAIAPAGVIAVGLALMVGSRTGAHGGLIALGVVLTAISAVTGTFEGPFTAGDRAFRPTSVAELEDVYELGVGNLVVDLRQIDFPADNTDVEIRLNIGDLRVHLPDDVAVGIDSTVGIGDLRVLGRHESGLGPDIQLFDDPPGPSGVLTLDTSVGIGNVEVDR